MTAARAAIAVASAVPRRDGDRDRGPRRDGGGGRGGEGRGGDRGDRGPRRERSEGGNNDGGPAPEFAPAFLTRDDD